MRRNGVVLLLAAVAAFAVGCGEEAEPAATTLTIGEQQPVGELSARERRVFDRSLRRIQRHCRRWARSLTQGEPLSQAAAAPGFAAVDDLLALLASKPRAPIGRSADVRLRVGDVAESVEGANCDPRLEDRLDQGIAATLGG